MVLPKEAILSQAIRMIVDLVFQAGRTLRQLARIRIDAFFAGIVCLG
jgi:hypothetical protein